MIRGSLKQETASSLELVIATTRKTSRNMVCRGITLRKGASVKIKKAVITAAAPNQRVLPLQTLIDRDGEEKRVLGILVEQILAASIEEICVIVWPGDEVRYAEALGKHLGHVRFVAQPAPRGYGDAIWQAREFLAGEPFLHLVGDHLYVNTSGTPPTQRILELSQTEE